LNVVRRRKLNALRGRDGDRCWICGRQLLFVHDANGRLVKTNATFDHLVPHSLGGHAILPNLKLACKKCNSTRGHKPPPKDPWPNGLPPPLFA
jgi:5-methylcytosine-specific restriction endonuclease McrA